MTVQPSRLQRLIVGVLQVGLRASLIALALGLALAMIGAVPAAATLLLNIGLVILMATPIARVAVSATSYAAEGDWKYFFITLSVLAVLAVSVITALRTD